MSESSGDDDRPDDLDRALDLYERGRAAREAGEIEEAVELFRQSAAEDPHFKTLEALGEGLLVLGRAKEAVVPLAASSALNRQVRAPSLLADALLLSGNALAAYDAAQMALLRDPSNARALRVAEKTKAAHEAWQRLGE